MASTTPKANYACLFDLDGVLVDTAVYHYRAWRRLANQLGFDFSEQQNEQLKGISRIDSLGKLLAWGNLKISKPEMEALASQKNEWYVQMIDKMTPDEVLPGVLPFLTSCKAIGYKMALGSASKNTALILERTNIAHFFDAIIDGNSVSKSKPDPEVFLKGAHAVNVQPQNCIVFEDATAGIVAGKSAGMKTVGIGHPHVLTQADLVVSSLNRLSTKDLAILLASA